MDGTLIDSSDRIRPLTRSRIAAAYEAGVPLVLATGRPPRWIAEITDQLDVAPYAVCGNGAVCYDVAADKVLHSKTLSTKKLAELVTIAKRFIPGCGLAAERVGASAHDSVTAPFVATGDYEHAWLNPDHIEVSEDDIVSERAVKLLVRQPNMTSDAMAALLTAPVGNKATVTYSTNNGLIEINPREVDKATGLVRLAEIVGFPVDSVVAFGDMPNDVAMLRWAQRGVAMANAHPLAKAAADEITTDCDNDGVGRVLARWF